MATKLSKLLFGQQMGPTEPSASSPLKSDASAIRKVMEVEQKQHEKEQKTDDKLIKAITKLTEQMIKKDKDIAKGGLTGYIAQKKDQIKQLMTFGGAAKAIGKRFGVEQDDGSLAGAVLGSVTKRQDAKKAEKEFAQKFSQYTDEGRKLGGKEAAATKGVEVFRQIKEHDKTITTLQAEKERAEEFGGALSKEDQTKLDTAIAEKKKITDAMKGKPADEQQEKKESTTDEKQPLRAEKNKVVQPIPEKERPADGGTPLTPEMKQVLGVSAVEGMRQEYNTLTDDEKKVFKDANPEMVKGLIEGSLDELTKISQQQLDALLDLLKLQTPSEEDRLESKLKDNSPVEARKEDQKEEKKGLLGKALDFLKGGFSGLFKQLLGNFAGLAMKALGPLATIVTSLIGIIGKVGGGVLQKIPSIFGKGTPTTVGSPSMPDIPDIPDKNTPNKTTTKPGQGKLGKAANAGKNLLSRGAGLASRAMSFLGPTAAVAGAAYAGWEAGGAINDLVEEKTGAQVGSHVYDLSESLKEQTIGGLLGMKQDKQKLQEAEHNAHVELGTKKLNSGEKISKETADHLKKAGVKVPEEMIRAPGEVAQPTATKQVVAQKTETPSRVEQTKNLVQNEETAKTLDAEKEKKQMQISSSPTVIQSPTSVVNNNSSVVSRISPRNIENQFNRRMRQIYS